MVERLDAPQPTFPLPPLAEIPDEDEDRADDSRRIITAYGPTDESVPAIVFGAASFSAYYHDDEHIRGVTPLRATRLALRYGIKAFDTAPLYGPSEIVLGNALQALSTTYPRSSYQLFTKCGRYGDTRDAFDYTPAGIRTSVQRSLARLHTTYLDVVYLHDVEFVAPGPASTPRTAGDHRGALGGQEAAAYGLAEGQEAVVYGEGDRAVLQAVGELRRLQDAGVIRRVGISGYPLPALLRIALLIKHTPPYTPLDVVMSYCHLTVQNRTLLAFKAALERRAGVRHVLTASPLSMRLLTPNPPTWHPASGDIRAGVARAVRVCERPSGGGGEGLPELALEYAFQQAKEMGIPTVVGLGSLRDVHENARIWYSVDKARLGEDPAWQQRVQQVLTVFEEDGVLDQSWETPRFRE